ncbi:hypothetical protein C8Q72DRAFT_886299 [Fomitopsis betulina]|nr:hypothetical protein C8Q72DRAFT_886299 [Fomitopsis betulina]
MPMVSGCWVDIVEVPVDAATIIKDLTKDELAENTSLWLDLQDYILPLVPLIDLTGGDMDIIRYTSVIKQACSDDGSKVKTLFLKFLPTIKGAPCIKQDLVKHKCGFNHVATSCQLCPASLQSGLDKTPEEFCMLVRTGKVQITAGHFPALMYPEDGYSSDAPENNLLKSPLMATIYHAIMTGLRTAKAPKGAHNAEIRSNLGKKSIAKMYAITEAYPETIAYVATITCFALDTQVEWCDQDTEFVYFNDILLLFKDAEWRADVIQWYNIKVYGPGHCDDSGRLLAGPAMLNIIAARWAKRIHANVTIPHHSDSGKGDGPVAVSSTVTVSSSTPVAGLPVPSLGPALVSEAPVSTPPIPSCAPSAALDGPSDLSHPSCAVSSSLVVPSDMSQPSHSVSASLNEPGASSGTI